MSWYNIFYNLYKYYICGVINNLRFKNINVKMILNMIYLQNKQIKTKLMHHMNNLKYAACFFLNFKIEKLMLTNEEESFWKLDKGINKGNDNL